MQYLSAIIFMLLLPVQVRYHFELQGFPCPHPPLIPAPTPSRFILSRLSLPVEFRRHSMCNHDFHQITMCFLHGNTSVEDDALKRIYLPLHVLHRENGIMLCIDTHLSLISPVVLNVYIHHAVSTETIGYLYLSFEYLNTLKMYIWGLFNEGC